MDGSWKRPLPSCEHEDGQVISVDTRSDVVATGSGEPMYQNRHCPDASIMVFTLGLGASDLARSERIHVLGSQQGGHTDSINCLRLTENARKISETSIGGYLLSASTDKSIIVWDLQTGRPYSTSAGFDGVLRGHTDCVTQLELIEDSQVLSCSHDATILLHEWKTGSSVRVWQHPSAHRLTAMHFYAPTNSIAYGDENNEVNL